jgi:hypothetical protein
MEAEENEYIKDETSYVEVCVGVSQWKTLDGKHILEEDFKVDGEIWRVHKSDADPYPSNPHAHCIGGKARFVGCTLHLGTAQLYRKREPLGRRMEENQFMRLIELIRPKFPGIKLPLQQEGSVPRET